MPDQLQQVQPHRLLHNVYTPLASVCGRLASTSAPWLVAGSTSCLLQGVHLETEPNDIDLYTDRGQLVPLEQALADWMTVPTRFSETTQYASFLSRYDVQAKPVELVADLRVRTAWGTYTVEVAQLLYRFAKAVALAEHTVRLVPLEHEYIFNLLRERKDRYAPIAAHLRLYGVNRRLWHQLQARNTLSAAFWQRAASLVDHSPQEGSAPCGS